MEKKMEKYMETLVPVEGYTEVYRDITDITPIIAVAEKILSYASASWRGSSVRMSA